MSSMDHNYIGHNYNLELGIELRNLLAQQGDVAVEPIDLEVQPIDHGLPVM